MVEYLNSTSPQYGTMEKWNTGILRTFGVSSDMHIFVLRLSIRVSVFNTLIGIKKSSHGETSNIDPNYLDSNTEVMRF